MAPGGPRRPAPREALADERDRGACREQRERLARAEAVPARDNGRRGHHPRDENFDAPAAREDYVHGVGRAGRAGQKGVGITFAATQQVRDIGRIARELALGSEFARSDLAD